MKQAAWSKQLLWLHVLIDQRFSSVRFMDTPLKLIYKAPLVYFFNSLRWEYLSCEVLGHQ